MTLPFSEEAVDEGIFTKENNQNEDIFAEQKKNDITDSKEDLNVNNVEQSNIQETNAAKKEVKEKGLPPENLPFA
jgi:hypothetical protein